MYVTTHAYRNHVVIEIIEELPFATSVVGRNLWIRYDYPCLEIVVLSHTYCYRYSQMLIESIIVKICCNVGRFFVSTISFSINPISHTYVPVNYSYHDNDNTLKSSWTRTLPPRLKVTALYHNLPTLLPTWAFKHSVSVNAVVINKSCQYIGNSSDVAPSCSWHPGNYRGSHSWDVPVTRCNTHSGSLTT